MRSGFWVCANACKGHALLPEKLPRPAICTFRFATLLTFETLALYSRISPAFKGKLVSTGGALFFASVGFEDFPGRTSARFAAGGGWRKPGGSRDTTSGKRGSPLL